MFNRGAKDERTMSSDRFIVVEAPSRAEGIARALQIAFRDGYELPQDIRHYVDRLDRIRT